MVEKVVGAPINLYFDKTPSGKILNRFSNDIDKIDNEFPRYAFGWFSCFRDIIWTIECFACAAFDIYVAALNR